MEWMFLPLKRYAEFSGRSRRMEYWMWVVFQFLLLIALFVLMMIFGGAAFVFGSQNSLGGAAAMGIGIIAIYGIFVLIWLALIIPSIAVAVRRLHDINRTGWWLLAPLAAQLLSVLGAATGSGALRLIGGLGGVALGIVLLVFYFLDGTPGDNRFGPDPKGRGTAEVFA